MGEGTRNNGQSNNTDSSNKSLFRIFFDSPATNYTLNYNFFGNVNNQESPQHEDAASASMSVRVKDSSGFQSDYERVISGSIFHATNPIANGSNIISGTSSNDYIDLTFELQSNASVNNIYLRDDPRYATNSADFTLNWELSTAPAPVPVPAAVWLMGSGLLGLIGFSRKRNASSLAA